MTHCKSCVLAVDAGGTSLKAALIPEWSEDPMNVKASGNRSPQTTDIWTSPAYETMEFEVPAEKISISPTHSILERLAKQTFFSIPVPSDGGREEILEAYRAVGKKGADLAAEAGLVISRAAVCIPGPFDYAGGRSLMKHKYAEIYGIPLRPSLREGMGADCAVTFLHDSTAFLLGAVSLLPGQTGVSLYNAEEDRDLFSGENVRIPFAEGDGRDLSGRDSRKLCGVIIGTGLGFACMKDGGIWQNPEGGPAVSLYARPYLDGTSEDYVSKRGILNRYRLEAEAAGAFAESLPTVADIASLARRGDAIALKVFADTGFHLGQILLPVLTEYGFDTVLLGGAISKSADLFLPQLSAVLADAGARAVSADEIDLVPLLGAALYRDTVSGAQSRDHT